MKDNHWHIKANRQEVALFSQTLIMQSAQEAIQARGLFKIVLAGGTTPKQIYSLLATATCDWDKWHLYLGDERCLPLYNIERNSHMIQQELLDKIDFPENNIHFIAAELGATKAALAYQKTIHLAFPFDLVMLGMGEDGHTASLFPSHQHNTSETVHAVFNAPKPPAERVSLSIASLSQTKTLLRIITGANKTASIALWQQGEVLPITEPSSINNDIILLDQSAMGKTNN